MKLIMIEMTPEDLRANRRVGDALADTIDRLTDAFFGVSAGDEKEERMEEQE